VGSPCDRCIAPCCREPHVLLTGREALRIASALALPLAAFTELRPRERSEGGFRILLAGPEPGSRRYHRLELRRVPTPEQAHMQRCVFLTNAGTEESEARCGIYPLRPGPCRAFPFQREGAVLRLSRISRAYCPPGAWRLSDADGELPQQLLLRELDQEIYDALIDFWNERIPAEAVPPDAARYFEFLEASYGSLERTAPELLDGTAHHERWEGARLREAVASGLRSLW
jgi:Fe-S-cluster containining protein